MAYDIKSDVLVDGIVTANNFVGDGAGLTGVPAAVADDSVTNAKLAEVATATLKGRTTAGAGNPEDLTVAQAKTLLNLTGTNSGDQTSIAGITGTLAQFNTAVTDANLADDSLVVHLAGAETITGLKTIDATTGLALPATSGTTPSAGTGLRIESFDNTILDIGSASTLNWLQSTDKSDLSVFYSLLLNPRGGNVGIGSTAPIFPFHLSREEDIAGLKTYGSQSEGLGVHYSRNTSDDYRANIDFIANRTSSGSAGGAGFRWFYQPRSAGFPTLGLTLASDGAITAASTITASNLSGTNTGDQTNISGNAATVTTNANLTGPVTSVGNATAIANGAISNAMLANSAVANLSGTNTGDNAANTNSDLVHISGAETITGLKTIDATTGLALPATTGTTPSAGTCLRLESSNNTILDIGADSTLNWIQSTDKANLANGYPLLLNPNGGNVGVGSTGAPTYKITAETGYVGAKAGGLLGYGTGGNQLIYGYDASNRMLMNISSAGAQTWTMSGASASLNIADGNVGLGGVPSSLLHIFNGGTGTRGALRISDSGTNYWEIGRDNTVTGDFTFNLNAAEKMRITTNGYAGVNSTPDGTCWFQVKGNTGVLDNTAKIYSGDSSTAVYRGTLALQHNSDTTIVTGSGLGITFAPLSHTGGGFVGLAKISGVRENATSNNQDTALSFITRAGASNSTTDTEKMRITSLGLIGLNTVTPLSMVAIRGSGTGTNGFVKFHKSNNDVPYVGSGFDETNDTFSIQVNTGGGDLNTEALAVSRTTAVSTFKKACRGSQTTLTSTSNSIAINFDDSNDFIHTFTENTTLANPSNVVVGQSGSIFLTQHASAPKTLAFGSNWDFVGGTVPVISTTNSTRDRLDYTVRSATQIEVSLSKAWA